MRADRRWWVPSAEVVTVGLPFCVFKVLTGMVALQATTPWRPLGYALVTLGAVDAVLNTVNLLALLFVHRRASAACLLELVVRRVRRDDGADVGLALDVFVSFALVAVVVGVGLLRHLPGWALALWNAAVVLNVLGAGVGRLLTALRRDRAVRMEP